MFCLATSQLKNRMATTRLGIGIDGEPQTTICSVTINHIWPCFLNEISIKCSKSVSIHLLKISCRDHLHNSWWLRTRCGGRVSVSIWSTASFCSFAIVLGTIAVAQREGYGMGRFRHRCCRLAYKTILKIIPESLSIKGTVKSRGSVETAIHEGGFDRGFQLMTPQSFRMPVQVIWESDSHHWESVV